MLKPPKICQCCYEPATSKCAKCCYTRYCSSGCQKSDWRHHKKVCDRINNLATTDWQNKPMETKFRQLQQEIKGNQGETCGLCLAIPRFRTELDRSEFLISKLCEPCFLSACTKTNALCFYINAIRSVTTTYRENGRFMMLAR